MTAFTFDTSGEVPQDCPACGNHSHCLRWEDLDPFTQGYIDALFAGWTVHIVAKASTDSGLLFSSDVDGPPAIFDKANGRVRAPSFRDLAPETLARIITDCAWFRDLGHWTVFDARTGADLWRDRQSGQLTLAASRRFPPLTPFLGDDGRVYLRDGV